MEFPLDGLAAYWTLDETSGTRRDVHGTTHLTPVNGAGAAPGKIKIGAALAAASGQYLFHDDPAPLGDESFTYALWVQRASIGDSHLLIGKDQPSGRDYFLQIEPAGAISWQFMHDGGVSRVVTPPVANDTSWHFVLASYDADADLMSLRVDNGAAITRATVNGPWQQPGPVCFGARIYPGFEWYLNGILDEIGLWRGRTLTAAEGSTLWNAGAGLPYPIAPTAPRLPLVGALRARLLALPDVTALVGTRVYTLEFPQSLTAPALRLFEVDRLSSMQLRGDVAIRRTRVQVDAVESDAHGDPYALAHQLSAAVRGDVKSGTPSGLVGFRGDLSGIPIQAIAATDQREFYDAPTRLVRVEQEFIVWFQA